MKKIDLKAIMNKECSAYSAGEIVEADETVIVSEKFRRQMRLIQIPPVVGSITKEEADAAAQIIKVLNNYGGEQRADPFGSFTSNKEKAITESLNTSNFDYLELASKYPVEPTKYLTAGDLGELTALLKNLQDRLAEHATWYDDLNYLEDIINRVKSYV